MLTNCRSAPNKNQNTALRVNLVRKNVSLGCTLLCVRGASTASLWKHSRQLGAASRSAAAEKTHGTTKHLCFRCNVMETEQLVRRNLLGSVGANHRRSGRAAKYINIYLYRETEIQKLRLPCWPQSYCNSASETLPNCTDTSMEENTPTPERDFKG